jgi:glycosyltransferase involved in cell wall biosynthesis
MNKKLIRITTVPMALRYLLPGQMRFMASNGFDVVMISADGKELPEVIANEQCRHIIVPMTRKITPLQDIKCLRQLIKIFKKERPDIVHTHTPKAGLLGMMAARYCGIKVRIHTVAGLPLMVEKGFKYRLLKCTEKLTYSSATQVWPNSHSLLTYIKQHRLCNEKKLKVIGKGSSNGIDTARFNKDSLKEEVLHRIKASVNYSTSDIYFLCVGRLVADKGIVELVNTFLQLQQQNSTIKLILVGQYERMLDPLSQQTEQEIETNSGIVHIDWSNEVEYYMAIANYFVFPSHREGFPNVLLQAGAMQLPILCSRIPGNIDIVTHQQTGLIFDKGNEGQLQQAIEYALSQPGEMKAMADKLYHIVQQDYQRENMWQQILITYRSLLN